MYKTILKITSISFLMSCILSCTSLENQLLEPKIYFEKAVTNIKVEGQTSIDFNINVRLTSLTDEAVPLTYSLEGQDAVDAYNAKYGTDYKLLDISSVSLDKQSVQINSNKLFSEPVKLTLNNLSEVKEGNTYIVVIKVMADDVVVGNEMKYLILSKPIRIIDVANFSNGGSGNSIKVPFTSSMKFTSVTYEALIWNDSLEGNNTIMGGEGKLIFRIGDPGGGLAKDLIQIAGTKQFNSPNKLEEKRWYHVAFTYDGASSKARIYVNGTKVGESEWSLGEFDLMGWEGFWIGRVHGFPWGQRPFHGKMSEVRVWNVARTENDLINNMLNVKPDSEGLVVYYKLNDKAQYQDEEGKWRIKNLSKQEGMDGLVNKGGDKIEITHLTEPVKVL